MLRREKSSKKTVDCMKYNLRVKDWPDFLPILTEYLNGYPTVKAKTWLCDKKIPNQLSCARDPPPTTHKVLK